MVQQVIKGIEKRFKLPTKKKKPISCFNFQKLFLGITNNGHLDNFKFSDLRFVNFIYKKLACFGDRTQILFPTLWARGNVVKPLFKIASYKSVLLQIKKMGKIN